MHPQAERAPPWHSKSPMFEEFGEIWTVGEVSFSLCFEGDN